MHVVDKIDIASSGVRTHTCLFKLFYVGAAGIAEVLNGEQLKLLVFTPFSTDDKYENI